MTIRSRRKDVAQVIGRRAVQPPHGHQKVRALELKPSLKDE